MKSAANPAAASTAMPVAVFELTLGVWLVVKGLGERLSAQKSRAPACAARIFLLG